MHEEQKGAAEMPEKGTGSGELSVALQEVERLKIENILLRQEAEFSKRFDSHREQVGQQIEKGNLRLGFAGFVLLILAWLGTYRELGAQVKARLDEEFGKKRIQASIADAANKATREVMRRRIIEFNDSEHNRLKCLVDKQSMEIFLLQCRLAGGQVDSTRNVCIGHGGAEIFSFQSSFPEVDCDKIKLKVVSSDQS